MEFNASEAEVKKRIKRMEKVEQAFNQIERNEKWMRRAYIVFGFSLVLLTMFSVFFLGLT